MAAWHDSLGLVSAVPTSVDDPLIIWGDALEELATLADQEYESVHFVVADPPYFLDGLPVAWSCWSPRVAHTLRRRDILLFTSELVSPKSVVQLGIIRYPFKQNC